MQFEDPDSWRGTRGHDISGRRPPPPDRSALSRHAITLAGSDLDCDLNRMTPAAPYDVSKGNRHYPQAYDGGFAT